MSEKTKMNSEWKLYYGELSESQEQVMEFLKKKDQWMDVTLPCDVHMPLIERGIIKEPLVGDASTDCEWIEEKAWWFSRDIALTEQDFNQNFNIKLVFEQLDIDAKIWVNGAFVGEHRSSHYAFEKDVKNELQVGHNVVLVRLTTGYETIEQERVDPLKDKIILCGNRGDKRRAFSRKP